MFTELSLGGGIEALAESLDQMEPRWSALPGTEGDQMDPTNLKPTGAERHTSI